MKDWQYTIDGYGSIVTVKQNIDNSVSAVLVDLDGYAKRQYTQEEVDAGESPAVERLEWVGEEEPQYDEFGQGAHAKLKYEVEDGVAAFAGVKDEMYSDGEYNFPAWVRLIGPTEQLVENVPGVERVEDTVDELMAEVENGRAATIRGQG